MADLTPAHKAYPPRDVVLANELNFAAYNLPQLPESDLTEVYERLLAAEQSYASPDLSVARYEQGTASVDDEFLTQLGSNAVLLTSEHATAQRRPDSAGVKKMKSADYGTVALGSVVHEDTGANHLSMRGRQTGDANYEESHGFKTHMARFLDDPANHTHFSLHAVAKGRVSTLADERGFNVLIGVGENPSEETMEVVTALRAIGRAYDLRVGVNERIIKFSQRKPVVKEDGSMATTVLAGKGRGTTRTFSEQYVGSKRPFAPIQLEFSTSLLLLPPDSPNYPGTASQRIGSYLGFSFLRDIVQLRLAQ